MYLSKLVLNDRDPIVQRDLSNAHALHQRIMQAFPDEEPANPRANWNVLFRQELDSEVVLVQSGIAPNWTHLPSGYLNDRAETPVYVKPFDPQVSYLEPGRILQFRLKANPSKRDKDTRKTIGLYHQTDQLAWLERQATRHGFTVHGVDVIPTPNVFGSKAKGNSPIRIFTVLYQGMLQVTDSQLLLTALYAGIGRGKSYGCGLLSIARIQH